MGSTGASSSKGSSRESQLSQEQAKILQSREAQYQALIFPELRQAITDANSPAEQSRTAQPVVSAVNSAYTGARTAMNQDLARRGIADSGMAAQGAMSLQQARVSTLADAYAKAIEAQRQSRVQLMQMGGSLSPQPTSAAPMQSTEKSDTKGSNWISGIFTNWS